MPRKLIKVDSDKNLARDPKSGAILSTSGSAIEQMKKIKADIKNSKENLKSDINEIKDELSDLKVLIIKVLESRNNGQDD